MRLSRITTNWTRVVAIMACLMALLGYGLTPSSHTSASGACECKLQSLLYSEGACFGGQRCICSRDETGCVQCRWQDDTTCP